MAEKKVYEKPVSTKRVAADLVSGSSKSCSFYRKKKSGNNYYH
jgi:hypothetical protein